MGKGQTYWALSKQPADGYTGGMSPTVYLSRMQRRKLAHTCNRTVRVLSSTQRKVSETAS